VKIVLAISHCVGNVNFQIDSWERFGMPNQAEVNKTGLLFERAGDLLWVRIWKRCGLRRLRSGGAKTEGVFNGSEFSALLWGRTYWFEKSKDS